MLVAGLILSGEAEDWNVIAFLVSAFVIGFVVVYLVPMVNSWAARVPGTSKLVNNKFAQLLIVGAVVLLGLHIFMALAQRVER